MSWREVDQAAAALRQVDGVECVIVSGESTIEINQKPDVDRRAQISSLIARSGWGLLEMRPMRMSLEDIFLSLTTEEPATGPREEAPVEGDTAHA